MSVLICCTNLPGTFLIPRITERDTIINVSKNVFTQNIAPDVYEPHIIFRETSTTIRTNNSVRGRDEAIYKFIPPHDKTRIMQL
jgi:hypothetical protein